MSKSVLVIATPVHCNSCDLRGGTFHCFCKVNHRDIEDLGIRPDWCPLKPAPKKMVPGSRYIGEEDIQYIKGWNDCRALILGEKTDE